MHLCICNKLVFTAFMHHWFSLSLCKEADLTDLFVLNYFWYFQNCLTFLQLKKKADNNKKKSWIVMTPKNTLRWLDGVKASNPTDWLRWIYTLQIWSYCSITARTNTTKQTALGWNNRIFRKRGQGFQVLTQSVSGDGRQGQRVVSHRLILDYLEKHKKECVTETPVWHSFKNPVAPKLSVTAKEEVCGHIELIKRWILSSWLLLLSSLKVQDKMFFQNSAVL